LTEQPIRTANRPQGMIAYAFQRSRRDLDSVTIVQAQRFDVVVDDEVADEAARLLQGV
jgi:hypothetical protein